MMNDDNPFVQDVIKAFSGKYNETDYAALALWCLDQAGMPADDQAQVAEIVRRTFATGKVRVHDVRLGNHAPIVVWVDPDGYVHETVVDVEYDATYPPQMIAWAPEGTPDEVKQAAIDAAWDAREAVSQ